MSKLTIEKISSCVINCDKCTEKASKTILLGRRLHGKTNRTIDILFLGEAPKPDRYNIIQKRVIFGEYSPTGQRLLDFIHELEQKVSDMTCWGTNCVKCDVVEDFISSAITNCRNYLLQELSVLKPGIIVMLGASVVKNVVGEKLSVGRALKWNNYTCIHSYHPMERTGRFIKNKSIVLKTIQESVKNRRNL